MVNLAKWPDYTDEELAFLEALDAYKKQNRRPHPTMREVLAVAVSQGYRLVAEPTPVQTFVPPPQKSSARNFRRRPLMRVMLPPLPKQGSL